MTKQAVFEEVQKLESFLKDSCQFLWNHPETGGNEKESADYMRKIMEAEGFKIVNEEHLAHAFYAEYGKGSPVVAVLGEYDALPALSQKVSSEKEAIIAGAPGHGCGHNLLGTAAATAAIAIKHFMEAEGISGTIRFYGCPEEELLSGKVKMAYYHMFDGCDVAISWHPMSANMVYNEGYLASASAKFYFKGKTAHAAFAPDRGRSALDAVELMNVGSNYLREHVMDFSRIHYTTDSCGFPPNIVPDKASAWYCVRAPHIGNVKEILERIHKVAKGAAMMTETEVEMKLEYGCCEIFPNVRFADLAYENMKEAPVQQYTEEEIRFAKELQSHLDPAVLAKDEKLYHAEGMGMFSEVCDRELWRKAPLTASSDSGDVSYMMPMCAFTTACWPVGVAPHTWQATAATGCSLGEKGTLYAAQVIAGIAYDLFTKPGLVEELKEEFRSTSDGTYAPMYEA